MCSNGLMERRKHWWNSHWGRMARHDILVYEDGGQWWIEDREGGADGRSRWLECPDEDSALGVVQGLMVAGDDWRELRPG